MRTSLAARLLLVVAVYLSMAATCGRGVAVESESGPIYTLVVNNTTSRDIQVSYNDGGGAQLLGTVSAGGSESFVVARPASLSITVTGRASGSGQMYTRNVTLSSGGSTTVSF